MRWRGEIKKCFSSGKFSLLLSRGIRFKNRLKIFDIIYFFSNKLVFFYFYFESIELYFIL